MARPVGSKTKPQIRNYIGKKDIEMLVEKSLKKAKEGDAIMLKFLSEQVFGRASQSMDVTSGGKELQPLLVKFINGDKNTK